MSRGHTAERLALLLRALGHAFHLTARWEFWVLALLPIAWSALFLLIVRASPLGSWEGRLREVPLLDISRMRMVLLASEVAALVVQQGLVVPLSREERGLRFGFLRTHLGAVVLAAAVACGLVIPLWSPTLSEPLVRALDAKGHVGSALLYVTWRALALLVATWFLLDRVRVREGRPTPGVGVLLWPGLPLLAALCVLPALLWALGGVGPGIKGARLAVAVGLLWDVARQGLSCLATIAFLRFAEAETDGAAEAPAPPV